MTPYALFIALVLTICALGFLGSVWGYLADRIDAWSQRRVDRMVEEALAATDPAACIAADTWARERAKAAEWRAIQDAVAAAHFDITLDQIRALPEVRG